MVNLENLQLNKMKKLLLTFLSITLFFVSCKKEELADPCGWPVLEKPIVDKDIFFQSLSVLSPNTMTKEQADHFRERVHRLIQLGGLNIDSANKCYSLTIDEWFPVLNNDPGGPACGGIAIFAYRILDSIAPSVPSATISIQHDGGSSKGHAICLWGITQDDSLVYSPQDCMFNTTVVWKHDPDKLVDIRDIFRMAHAGTAADSIMNTPNNTASYYMQESPCIWDENTYYIPEEVVSVRKSGREQHPNIIESQRHFERYAKYFSGDGETFSILYNDIAGTYNLGPYDWNVHPEELVNLYACVFGFIIANDEMPTEIFTMFGAYKTLQVPVGTMVPYMPGQY